MKINKGFLYRLIKATFSRKTLLRFLQNETFRKITLSGKTLDLGGNSNSQYYDYISIENGSNITYSDLHDKSDNVLNMDFTKPFPINDREYDNVIIMNVIEHLDGYDLCLREIKRILKNDGSLTGAVPFLFPVHMVPDDFHRPTESSLYMSLKNSGFTDVEVTPIGFGRWTAAANLCGQNIKFKPFTLILYLLALFLDQFDKDSNKTTNGRFRFPMGYLFKARSYDGF